MEKLDSLPFPLPLEIALALVKSPEQIEKFCKELVEQWMNWDFSSPVAAYVLKNSKQKYGGLVELQERTLNAPNSWDFSSTFETLPPHWNEHRQKRGILNAENWKNYTIPDFKNGLVEELWLMIVDEFRWDQKALSEIGYAWADHLTSQILERVIELTEDEDFLKNGLGYNLDLPDDYIHSINNQSTFKSMQISEDPFLRKIKQRLNELKIRWVWMQTRGSVNNLISWSNHE